MKTIKLKPTEFFHFRALALSVGLLFGCSLVEGFYIVKANEQRLEELGY